MFERIYWSEFITGPPKTSNIYSQITPIIFFRKMLFLYKRHFKIKLNFSSDEYYKYIITLSRNGDKRVLRANIFFFFCIIRFFLVVVIGAFLYKLEDAERQLRETELYILTQCSLSAYNQGVQQPLLQGIC